MILKKLKAATFALALAVLIAALAGCAAVDGPWSLAQEITTEDIKAVAVFTDTRFSNAALSKEEIETLVSLLNSLEKENFTENKRLAGGTPTYGLIIETSGGTTYQLNESFSQYGALETSFDGKQWWIDSEALSSFAASVTTKSGTASQTAFEQTEPGTTGTSTQRMHGFRCKESKIFL